MTTNHSPELDTLLHEAMEADFQAEKARKSKNFQYLNQYIKKGQILFTGSSLMEHFPVAELYAESDLAKDGLLVYNRGSCGYTTDEFLRDIDTMLLDLEPSKLFINIGTNDMNGAPDTDSAKAPAAGDSNANASMLTDTDDEPSWMPHLLENYGKILQICREKLPETEIYLMAYYPINTRVISLMKDPFLKEKFKTRTNEKVRQANAKIAQLAEQYGCHYIDVNDGLANDSGALKPELTVEGVHMYPNGYRIVFENLKKYLQIKSGCAVPTQ